MAPCQWPAFAFPRLPSPSPSQLTTPRIGAFAFAGPFASLPLPLFSPSVVNCQNPTAADVPLNATEPVCSSGTTLHSVCTFGCVNGAVGGGNLTCNANGKWEAHGGCQGGSLALGGRFVFPLGPEGLA